MRDFAGRGRSPARSTRCRVKFAPVEADTRPMDPIGARLLAARIRAGVSVGTRIELVRDAEDDSGLCAGDRGIVEDIDVRGFVRVALDRGVAVEIDPERTPFRSLAA